MRHQAGYSAKLIAIAAVVAALTLICLYAASIVPWMHIALYFLSSVFGYALLCDRRYGLALLMYAAVSILAFILLPSKLPALVFVVLAGHFGVIRCYLMEKCRIKYLRVIITLVYCSFFTLLGVWLAVSVLGYPLDFSSLPAWLPGWAIVLLAEVLYLAWYWLYGFVAVIYDRRIRPAVNK